MAIGIFLPEYLLVYEDDESYKNIIMDIAHIDFPNLKEIYLGSNNIESIEVVSSIWMPSLTMFIFGIS